MPTGALLDPSNRWLGGATGDFSLYGALPAVTIGTANPARADPALLTVPIAPAPGQPGTQQASALEAAPLTEAGAPLAADLSPAAPPAPALQPATSLASAPDFAPQVAAPSGSGSIAPNIADTHLPLVSHAASGDTSTGLTHGLDAASLAAPTLAASDGIAAAAGLALAPPITALATPALDTPAVAGTVVAAFGTTTSDAAALLDGVAHDAGTPAIEATVGAVAATLPDSHATLDTVGHTVDTSAGVVTEAAATVADVLAAAPASAADLAPAITDDHLGGTDPAGGVSTLVSMVETAAVFEVGQPSDHAEPAGGSGSIIDSLAADEAPPALLGDAAHAADDLLPHHDDHGVPGLT